MIASAEVVMVPLGCEDIRSGAKRLLVRSIARIDYERQIVQLFCDVAPPIPDGRGNDAGRGDPCRL